LDHLGSTSLTTDASDNPVARQLYDAWGNVRLRGDLKTDIGYASQREDLSTNLMFYRARYFRPYALAEKYPTGITPEDLKKELAVDKTNQFQQPTSANFRPLSPAHPQQTSYGPDDFN
jgi:hypothetical protein